MSMKLQDQKRKQIRRELLGVNKVSKNDIVAQLLKEKKRH